MQCQVPTRPRTALLYFSFRGGAASKGSDGGHKHPAVGRLNPTLLFLTT